MGLLPPINRGRNDGKSRLFSLLVVIPSGCDFLILNLALLGHIPLLPLEESL